MILSFAPYDLAAQDDPTQCFPVLTGETLARFKAAFLPNVTVEERRDPTISPFYADLKAMTLPPVLFICGTNDLLLEDSVLMATKWQLSGGETRLELFPGAAHGFVVMDERVLTCARDAREVRQMFLREKLGMTK